MNKPAPVGVYIGDELKSYGFGEDHPFGHERMDAFWEEAKRRGIPGRVDVLAPVQATLAELERFHPRSYLDQVRALSARGEGFLDCGDTPAFPGVFEAGAYVVGTTLDACRRVMRGELLHAFVPIAGLHHGRRESAGGFCAFNDIGVAVETLRHEFGIERVLYVDIDAHHGDGVFYEYESDPSLYIVDFHEDGRFLFPGTGDASETGTGPATGTKLNVCLRPDDGDEAFFTAWDFAEAFIAKTEPEFIILQCGADSIAGDPITHLRFSADAHRHAATQLSITAKKRCASRLVALGGGGYNPLNIARGWTAVVEALLHV